jgi:hypothetical protein
MHEEIKSTLNSGNACYHSVHSLLSSRVLYLQVKISSVALAAHAGPWSPFFFFGFLNLIIHEVGLCTSDQLLAKASTNTGPYNI